MFLHDISGTTGLYRNLSTLRCCLRHALLSKSHFTVITNQWGRCLHEENSMHRASRFQDVSRDLASSCAARASVHHILPSDSQHPEQPTGLDIRLQDPWEIIQSIVTSTHGCDMVHRIRLIQDNLASMPSAFRRSTAGETLRKVLVSLQDRSKALEDKGQDDEVLWNELHWDLINLRLSKHESAPEPEPEPAPDPGPDPAPASTPAPAPRRRRVKKRRR